MAKLPRMKKPCANCPFRKDVMKGWLGSDRMAEILDQDSFICHKTAYGEDKDKRQCAGHMIIKGVDNGFVRLAVRLGHDLKLIGKELIFDSEEQCIDHHKRY